MLFTKRFNLGIQSFLCPMKFICQHYRRQSVKGSKKNENMIDYTGSSLTWNDSKSYYFLIEYIRRKSPLLDAVTQSLHVSLLYQWGIVDRLLCYSSLKCRRQTVAKSLLFKTQSNRENNLFLACRFKYNVYYCPQKNVWNIIVHVLYCSTWIPYLKMKIYFKTFSKQIIFSIYQNSVCKSFT